ncbi:MAG: cation diffusion facilitator family transporter [Phycisphaerales bacterium]
MTTARLQRNTIIGLAVSIALAGGKLVGGILGHSSALVTDAVESIGDTLGSVIVWWGLKVGEQGPDERHPYGYGRAETIAALGVGVMLVVAAAIIIVRALVQIMTPHEAPAAWTLGVLAVVVVVKEGLFRLVLGGADAMASDAARADAWHHRSDAITSAAAMVGILIAVWGPGIFNVPSLVLADEAAAVFAGVIIIFTASRFIAPSLRELLDASSPQLAEKVRRTAGAVEGVRLVEKVHARKNGRGYLIDMHLHVAPEITVREGHALAGRVKATIRREHPSVRHMLIHVEPAETENSSPGPSSAPSPDPPAQGSAGVSGDLNDR